MRRDWTKAELNRLAGAYYDAAFALHDRPAFAALPLDRQALHRRGVRAVLAALEAIEDEHRAAHHRARRRTVKVA